MTEPSLATTVPSGPITSRFGTNRPLVPGGQDSWRVIPSGRVIQVRRESDGDPCRRMIAVAPPPAHKPLGGMLRNHSSPTPRGRTELLGIDGCAQATSPAESRTRLRSGDAERACLRSCRALAMREPCSRARAAVPQSAPTSPEDPSADLLDPLRSPRGCIEWRGEVPRLAIHLAVPELDHGGEEPGRAIRVEARPIGEPEVAASRRRGGSCSSVSGPTGPRFRRREPTSRSVGRPASCP